MNHVTTAPQCIPSPSPIVRPQLHLAAQLPPCFISNRPPRNVQRTGIGKTGRAAAAPPPPASFSSLSSDYSVRNLGAEPKSRRPSFRHPSICSSKSGSFLQQRCSCLVVRCASHGAMCICISILMHRAEQLQLMHLDVQLHLSDAMCIS